MKNALIVVLVILLVGAAAAAVIHFAGPTIASELVKTETTYSVTGKITNGELSEKSLKVADGAAAMVKIEPAEGYDLPETVKVSGITDAMWDYNVTTGLVSLLKVSDDVTITATCPVAVESYPVTANIAFASIVEQTVRSDGDDVHIVRNADCYAIAPLTVTGAKISSYNDDMSVSLYDITGPVTISGACFYSPRTWMSEVEENSFALAGDTLKFDVDVPSVYLEYLFESLEYDQNGFYSLLWGEAISAQAEDADLLVAVKNGDDYLLAAVCIQRQQSVEALQLKAVHLIQTLPTGNVGNATIGTGRRCPQNDIPEVVLVLFLADGGQQIVITVLHGNK